MPNPFHEHMPRQALALAGWVLFWAALERLLSGLGLDDRGRVVAFLAVLAVTFGAGILAARARLFLLFTSVRFAVTQGAFLIAAAALALTSVKEVWRSLWLCALLSVLAASMLTVTWKRRPYPPSRLGFLMVHVAPSLVLLGILWERLGGPRAPSLRLIQTGFASLLLGSAWMFYLKPWLKRREAKGTRP